MNQLIGYFFPIRNFYILFNFFKLVGIVMLEREGGIVVSESVFRYFIHANLFFSLDDIATIAKKLSFFSVVNIDSILI